MEKLILLLLVPSCLALARGPPPLAVERAARAPEERWLNVRLNQFKAYDTDTFPMRFYYNPETGGPHVVIFVGGEWAIHPSWTQAGLAHHVATEVGAGLFYTEHRYYGHTRPTNDTRPEDLRFLNVDQALADLAQFITYIKSDDFEGGRYKEGKVALVGCSYAGSMATWMKLGYPHLVDVVFSDSGPLLAQEDFPEYLEAITVALREQGGESCVSAVEESMRAVQELTTTAAGLATLSTWFNTCGPLTSSPLDLATFFWFGVTEIFAELVQYATVGDIPAACSVLSDTQVEPAYRLASWIRERPYAQPCIESRYDTVLQRHTDLSYDSQYATMRLWTYQTCVEYGWFQSTSSAQQPFLDVVPLDYFHHMCRDFFGDQFDESLLRAGIARTRVMFGDMWSLPEGVVSVSGAHDPWAPVGPAERHARPLSPVHVVPEASHCQAVGSLHQNANPAVRRAQQAVVRFLSEALTGHEPVAQAAPRAAAAPLLALATLLAALAI